MINTLQIAASEPRGWSRETRKVKLTRERSNAVTPAERQFEKILEMYGEQELKQWSDDTRSTLANLSGQTILAIHQSKQ